jgi:hypothetical protein
MTMPQAPSPPGNRQGAIDGALSLIVVLLIVQMWLLTAGLEAYLAGHDAPALPAAVGSGALLLLCFALYRLIVSVDRDVRGPTSP